MVGEFMGRPKGEIADVIYKFQPSLLNLLAHMQDEKPTRQLRYMKPPFNNTKSSLRLP